MAFADALRGLLGGALDIVLPAICPTCETFVASQGLMCAACFRQTAFITDPACVRCGVPFAHVGEAGAERICESCRQSPPLFSAARAALRYDAQARRLILPLKHADRPDMARVLAPLMVRAGAAVLRGTDLLVPVPLHRRRLRARRYNQAAVLTQLIARQAGVPAMLDGLVRVRATPSLAEKGAAERAALISGSIVVSGKRAGAIGGKRVTVVDDVMTSGATANACAAALLAVGAASVAVLAGARVPDPRANPRSIDVRA
jgi:ComF family protein